MGASDIRDVGEIQMIACVNDEPEIIGSHEYQSAARIKGHAVGCFAISVKGFIIVHGEPAKADSAAKIWRDVSLTEHVKQ